MEIKEALERINVLEEQEETLKKDLESKEKKITELIKENITLRKELETKKVEKTESKKIDTRDFLKSVYAKK